MIKEIYLSESAGIARIVEYVRVAVPCGRGEVQPDAVVSIFDSRGKPQPSQSRTLKQWPDGSAKWLLVDFAATVSPDCRSTYRLDTSSDLPPVSTSVVQVTAGENAWQVDTGAGTFLIDAHVFRPFAMVRCYGNEALAYEGGSCLLSLDGKSSVPAVVEDIRIEDKGPLRTIVRLTGRFDLPAEKTMLFSCSLHFTANSMAVQIDFTLHNPAPAKHPGGLWDLGDAGSLLFRGLTFGIPCPSEAVTEICYTAAPGLVPQSVQSGVNLSIYQESSGGENWDSPVHRNREGIVSLGRRGYVVEVDEEEVAIGQQANPLLWCGSGKVGIAAAFPRFWQEFPKAISADADQLRIELFPMRFPELHELQGGEQKTHTFFVDFAAGPESLVWALNPLQAAASPEVYRASGIFTDLPGENDPVDQFITAADLFKKREQVDEYGWRNFGELYADHEAVNHKEDSPFVSHYNNQYDGLAGLYRKFFATGDPAWGELAIDLARHVRDVDIYHTNQDREEYNHGLFWHTDHYVDAGQSTHRSFSSQHLRCKPAHMCGGGPGAEHCYTTGLMLHYFQTGNPDFKDAVIALAEWELLALTGPQTLLAALKRGMGHIQHWRACKGSRKIFPLYPLTRGTGNAITACIDAFEVSSDRRFLVKAEELIKGAFHPLDDIDARNLLNAEVAWSYTVLLVAVAKYLDKKQELGQTDSEFVHARASLIAYAKWMCLHEYPYLNKPEVLEYPNETWAAQDLRKSVIFYQAARYAAAEDQRQLFLEKAHFFFDNSRNELARHKTSNLMRPLVLMLQNGWVGSKLFIEGIDTNTTVHAEQAISVGPTPYLDLGTVVRRIVSDIAKVTKQTCVKRELAWLRARVG